MKPRRVFAARMLLNRDDSEVVVLSEPAEKQTAKKSDAMIMAEAIRLVGEGVAVAFPVNGRSMLPFIVGGRDEVVLVKPERVKVGDIVLAKAERGYVIHRIVKLDGERVTLMGDGNLVGREHCDRADIAARVSHVVRAKRKKYAVDGFMPRLFAKIWLLMLPFRRYLLAIYRRMFGLE